MSSDSLVSAEEEQSVGLISNVMEARAEHLKTRNYRSLYYFTTALGVGMVVMVLTWLLKYRGGFTWSSNPALEFNWHPLLMSFGMLFLYGQSILVYRTGRSSPKKRLKIFHALIHSVTFIMAVIGLKAVFDSHNYAETKPIPNLYSLHSWLGLITVIIFTGQFVFGFVSFLYPGLSKTLRQAFLPVHVATGTATFTLALISALTGLTEKTLFSLKNYSDLPAEGILINFIALFLGFFGILVLYLVNDSDYKRSNLPEDEVALSGTD